MKIGGVVSFHHRHVFVVGPQVLGLLTVFLVQSETVRPMGQN
jgi:hypothetical protein